MQEFSANIYLPRACAFLVDPFLSINQWFDSIYMSIYNVQSADRSSKDSNLDF